MSGRNVHSQQIANAAKSMLLPLGCKRIGRSRSWVADQRFWAIVVDFQPSGFSKGSYLSVNASWLWSAKPYWSLDYGSRFEGFSRFIDEHQFAAVADRLATRAAEEVRKLRERFASIADIARQIAPEAHAQGWSVYHAAVAAGLAGDIASSQKLFRRLIDEPAGVDWHLELQDDSIGLAQKLHEPTKFRAAVLAIVEESRALHGLQPDPACLDAP